MVLTHPGFEKQEGEVRETLPVALEYARRGHLVVLLPPKEDQAGHAVESPDGFLDREDQPIEFKHCTTGTANNIYNNLSSASKHDPRLIRSLRITDAADILTIAEQLARKYSVSKTVDQVHILHGQRLMVFTKELYHSEGFSGIYKLLQ